MRSLVPAVVALAALLAPAARAEERGIEDLRSKLLEVLLDEARVRERTQAVLDLAAPDVPASARALLEALDKLAARTAQAEANAAKTRLSYEPYKGAAQASEREWTIKKRLLQQMERDDAILAGDASVLGAFGAAVAALKDRESLGFLDRAAAKDESVHARRVLDAALVRNAAANSREAARRGMADPDATVRLATLTAIADRKDAAMADLAIKALADPDWPLRQTAARALGAMGAAAAIGPLVAAMGAEEGRLVEDYGEALAKLTGAALGANPEAWRRWYEDHRAELSAKGVKPPPAKLGKVEIVQPVDYYGIETRSLRLLFLIDCSGSMNEVIGQEGVTTGEAFQGPKIEIAKRMLKAAVSKLHPATLFDVITFNTDARRFSDRLILATREHRAATNMRIDELVGRGGTYTYGALRLAFGLSDASATPAAPPVDTIFLLSDGAPTEMQLEDGVPAAPMDPRKIIDCVRQWNPFRAVKIHTIAIDPRIEKSGGNFVRFMRQLAEENGGTYTAIGAK